MDVAYMIEVFPRLLPALWTTIEISAISLALAMVIGIGLGVTRAFTTPRNAMTWFLDAYVFFVRGTPIIVQIYVLFFLAPELGLRIDVFWIGVIALTFNSAGYQIEIGRAAVQSVPVDQFDASLALGLSRRQTIWLVILPQAVRRMIAPLTNEMSQLIKASSVLSVITVFELHKAANAISSSSYKYVELLALQAVEQDDLVEPVEEFGTEVPAHDIHHLVLDIGDLLALLSAWGPCA